MSEHKRFLMVLGAVFAFVYLLLASIGGRPSPPLAVGLYVATAVLLTGSDPKTHSSHEWPRSFEPDHGGRRGADHATERLAAQLAAVTKLDPGARAHLGREIQRILAAAVLCRAGAGAAIPADLQVLTTPLAGAEAANAEQVDLTAQLTDPASLADLLSRIEAL